MILSCSNISKSFDSNVILDNCSFHAEDREKVAIVGINGAGKSTLFKIITGELKPDDGIITVAKNKTLAYLSQHPDIAGGHTIYEETLDVKKEIIEMESEVIATSPTDLGNKKPANPGAAYSRRRQGFWEDEE